MAYTIEANMRFAMDAVSRPDTNTSPGSTSQGNSRSFDAYGKSLTFNAASKPPVGGRLVDISRQMIGATEDVDLTSAPSAEDLAELISVNGLKLVGIELWAPKGNTGNITLIGSVTNGFPLLGAVDLVLEPGKRVQIGLDGEGDSSYVNPTQVVDATHKIIRISGLAGRKLYGLLMFGP